MQFCTYVVYQYSGHVTELESYMAKVLPQLSSFFGVWPIPSNTLLEQLLEGKHTVYCVYTVIETLKKYLFLAKPCFGEKKLSQTILQKLINLNLLMKKCWSIYNIQGRLAGGLLYSSSARFQQLWNYSKKFRQCALASCLSPGNVSKFGQNAAANLKAPPPHTVE